MITWLRGWVCRLVWLLALRAIRAGFAVLGLSLNGATATFSRAGVLIRLEHDAALEAERLDAVDRAAQRLNVPAGLAELPRSPGWFELSGSWRRVTLFTALAPTPAEVTG